MTIRTKHSDHLKPLAQFADGVIVGSAIVDRITTHRDAAGQATAQLVPEITALVKELAAATKRT